VVRQFEPVSHRITQATIDAYAELSGDHNPLHVDPEYAAGTEFGSTIAHGPVGLQAFFELISRWLGEEAPPPGTRVDVVYRAPVRPGDTVVCEAETTAEDGLAATCRVGETDAVTISAALP
jgi:3-hydroxybutyryl-CoA dehydratase